MGRIHLLSDEVIAKIAAGEVVESPAAVVKELVENSLDAGSTSIQVEIKNGGFNLICVEDNGIGMNQDDAMLSIQRHTTSKISFAEDLFALSTMGFRGEALASIGSVSKMKLHSSDGIDMVQIDIEGGSILSVEKSARERGTMIEVRSLFYNTPARKAFQKGSAPSTAEIIRLMIALSLSHPNIEFTLRSQDNTLLQTLKMESDDFQRLLSFRVQNVLGENFLSKALWIESNHPSYKISGFIGFPDFVRPNRLGQYLFINKRWVQSPMISSWVKDGYSSQIKEGSFPHFVLHIEMPKEHLDINVHPQKREIKIKETSELKKVLQDAMWEALSPPKESLAVETPSFSSAPFSFREDTMREWEKKTYQQTLPFTTPVLPPRALSLYHSFLFVEAKREEGRLIRGEEIWVVDLEAAFSKCLYVTLLSRENEKNDSHKLLLPLTLDLSKEEVFRFQEDEEFFQAAGFEIRAVGEYSLSIDAYPSFLREKDVILFLQKYSEEKTGFTEKKMRLAAVCNRFAKSRGAFQFNEAVKIFEKLLTLPSFFFCPIGKKTMYAIRPEDLSGFFR